MSRIALIPLLSLALVACSEPPAPTVAETPAPAPEAAAPAAAEPMASSTGSACALHEQVPVVEGRVAAPADVAAPPADATVTETGLAYQVLFAGSGDARPTATSEVEVHYTGWTTDGAMFDSSVVRAETIAFPLNRVIKGWTEGVQTMAVGECKRFWIPAALAYGDNPRPGAPKGMLVFDVELIAIR